MRVATYNAHRGRSPAGLFRPARIAEVIAEIRPDVIALQEAQHWLRPARRMFDEAAIAEATGLRPLRVAGCDQAQGWRGNVVLVRADAVLLRAPVGLRLGGWEPRGGILAELDLGAGALRLVATHLSLGAARRRLQAEAILAATGDATMPTLLLGDLNEWRSDGAALAALAPRFGVPAAVPTFPSFRPLLALDRIMADRPGLVRNLAAHDTPAARRASDHLPLTARFAMREHGSASSRRTDTA